jgi:hypothetical protein
VPLGPPVNGALARPAVNGALVPLMLGSGAREMSDFSRFIGGALLGSFGRGLMGALVRWRLFMKPELLLRNVAGLRSREALSDADATAACDKVIRCAIFPSLLSLTSLWRPGVLGTTTFCRQIALD